MAKLLHQVPSLDLLRGFVAVGRRMSITQAAQDLYLSPSAVSRQVRELEQRLGVSLFVRSFRALRFTPAGEQLFTRTSASLRDIQEAVGALAAMTPRRAVTLTTTAGIARLWLIPRLAALRALHPEIDLQITTDNRVLDLRLERIDLALRHMSQASVPPDATVLFREEIAPVASPGLLRNLGGSFRSRLNELVLLDLDDSHPGRLRWTHWLRSQGLDASRSAGVMRFNQYDQIIQAAADGLGVAIGRRDMVLNLLEAHKLVVWPGESFSSGLDAVCVLLRNGGAMTSEANTVFDWLASQRCAAG